MTILDNYIEKFKPLDTVGEDVNSANTIENNMAVPQKVKIGLQYDPAIPHLGIYPK